MSASDIVISLLITLNVLPQSNYDAGNHCVGSDIYMDTSISDPISDPISKLRGQLYSCYKLLGVRYRGILNCRGQI